MNNKIVTVSLLIILLAFNLIIILKFLLLRGKIDDLKDIINKNKSDLTFFLDKIQIENENNYLILNPNLNVVDMNEDTIKIKSIIKNNKLIFRYSVLNCSGCIEAEIENLSNFLNESKSDKNKICFLVYYENYRDLIVAYRTLKLDIPMYIVPQNSIGLPIEKQNVPFYFTIDSALNIKNMFIPNREYPELTGIYFKNIYSKII